MALTRSTEEKRKATDMPISLEEPVSRPADGYSRRERCEKPLQGAALAAFKRVVKGREGRDSEILFPQRRALKSALCMKQVTLRV